MFGPRFTQQISVVCVPLLQSVLYMWTTRVSFTSKLCYSLDVVTTELTSIGESSLQALL